MTGKLQRRQTENSLVRPRGRQSPGGAGADGAAPDTRETAAYIRDMAADLRDLADAAQLPMLAYLLDMVRAEANRRFKLALGPGS